MKAAVCLKGPKEKSYVATCDLEPEEFRRLISDFEKFRTEGLPMRGEYSRAGFKSGLGETEKILLEFENVLLIMGDPNLKP